MTAKICPIMSTAYTVEAPYGKTAPAADPAIAYCRETQCALWITIPTNEYNQSEVGRCAFAAPAAALDMNGRYRV